MVSWMELDMLGEERGGYRSDWRSCSFSAKATRFIWSRRTRALVNIPIGGLLARRRGVGNIVEDSGFRGLNLGLKAVDGVGDVPGGGVTFWANAGLNWDSCS